MRFVELKSEAQLERIICAVLRTGQRFEMRAATVS
jgi:hypothetical protein